MNTQDGGGGSPLLGHGFTTLTVSPFGAANHHHPEDLLDKLNMEAKKRDEQKAKDQKAAVDSTSADSSYGSFFSSSDSSNEDGEDDKTSDTR